MAVGAPVQQIGQIDPASLIGRADTSIVEPRATAALIDAFRQGVVSSDDIVSRIGELGQSKKKAEIDIAGAQSMQAQEAVSPEAQAARAAQTEAATLSAQKQSELARFPATAAFDQLAPGAGIEIPTLPDGVTPDLRRKEKLGAQLAAWKSIRDDAVKDLKQVERDIDPQTGAATLLLDNRPITTSEHDAILQRARMSFHEFGSRLGTGPAAAPAIPEVVPRALAPATAPVSAELRGRLADKFGADVLAAMPAEHVLRLAESETATPATAAVVTPAATVSARPSVAIGAPTASGGFQLRQPPAPAATKAPTDAQQRAQLALARFSQAGDMQAALAEAGYDPTSIGSWMSGMLPQVLKTGDRKQYEAAVDAWSQGLLRLESGAAISRQEKSWYEKAFFPQVRDPETVLLAKEAMRHDVERMVAEIAQQGGVVSPESIAQATRIYERAGKLVTGSSAAGAVAAAPTITLPSGKVVRRNAQGVFEEVQ